MENKIKIDDRVILRTDIAFQVPFGVTKGTILNVDLIEGDKARVSTPVVSFVVPLEFLTKVGEESVVKQEVKIVKRWEDLIGLKNGKGLEINDEQNICFGTTVVSDCDEFLFENYLKLLESMGFKFEYKPLRSIREVIEEMRLKSLDRFGSYEYKLFSVGSINKNSSYLAVEANGHFVGEYLFSEETAQKYADELNEILGGR